MALAITFASLIHSILNTQRGRKALQFSLFFSSPIRKSELERNKGIE
eukprot:UN21787